VDFVYSQLIGIESITLVVYLAVLLAGIFSAVSPCYIPILVFYNGFISAYAKENRKKAILMTLVFVLGMAITSAIIGGIAAYVGQSILKMFTEYRLDKWIAGIVGLIMGLHLIGIFKLRFPTFFSNRINWRDKKPTTLAGSFSLGLLFGFVVTPCTIPVFITVITLVALKGSVVSGSLLLLIYAIGKGLVLLMVALSSEFIVKMAGNGAKIEKISGYVILIASLYVLILT
jgi:cytochrome c-type biogenesis protein